MVLDKKYWNDRYLKGLTVWDIGYVSTPLKEYFDQLTNKELRILIPGCGNAYEAEYLTELGFKNVFLIDWSEIALNNFRKKVHHIPDSHLFYEDFFEHRGEYDLIVEQTFFSSILPSDRNRYAEKVHELLAPGGKLMGLLFDVPEFKNPPPFGGTKDEYIKYFGAYFEFKYFETAYNSIKPRRGREFFILFVKR